MNIGTCVDSNPFSCTCGKEIAVVVLPLHEMLASMHVICKPEHHTARLQWWKKAEAMLSSSLVERIRALGELCNQWMIPMDLAFAEPFADLEIPDALFELARLPLPKWNAVFALYGKKLSYAKRAEILAVLRDYHKQFFAQELPFIQSVLVRSMQQALQTIERGGFEPVLSSVHERLKVSDTELVYVKNQTYRYAIKDISSFVLTGSVFLAPHLMLAWLGSRQIIIETLELEQTEGVPPVALAKVYRALGDPTRLMLLRALKQGAGTTQALAKQFCLTEAAISKHLKILHAAQFVEKSRQGLFVQYRLVTGTLDFLSYYIYEYLN